MSTREARSFLEAISANPDDDLARLVYADWLEERGDAPRAEFIRTQVERATLPDWDARRVRLLIRERALLAQHEREWRAELPAIEGITWGEFRRGFVATATFASFAVFRTGWATCRAATPVEAVAVRWPRQRGVAPLPGLRELTVTGRLVAVEDLARLIESPVLSTLHTLTIRDAALGPDGFRRLASSPHLRNLTALRVPHNSIGNSGIDAVICAALPALTELDLSESGSYGRYAEDPIINASGMARLAGWPGLARLRSLSLSGNDLRRAGLRALLQSPHAIELKHLALRGNGLTGPAMQEFDAAPAGLQLDSLDLGENLLRDTGAGHLANAACLGGLKALHLDRCEFRVSAARKLAKAPFVGGLRVLNVGSNNLGPGGLAALLGGNAPELHTLGLTSTDLGPAAATVLAGSPASDSLLDVDLSWNGLGDKAAQALAASAHLRNLLVLRLTHNPLGKPAGLALAGSPLGKRLAVLDLPPTAVSRELPPVGDDIPF
ncbi:MAG TPA: TIGR02996 domain-containing protein [Gemmataceae bacterium]|nr:TIGR02996 domain-containing protein [Gemmataceae bacterium]